MEIKKIVTITTAGLAILCGGCATFRYSIIPQEKSGPHGGALVLIDQSIPDYVEFVAIPGEKEWIFQVFVFDMNLKQRSICGSGYLTVEFPDGTKKSAGLWNTKPYFWSKGKGHLENKMALKDVSEFVAKVSIRRGRKIDRLIFKCPYN
ncbi:MAG: hypothetical protein ABIJ53_03335 [Verrucomicrobiota bacterium]